MTLSSSAYRVARMAHSNEPAKERSSERDRGKWSGSVKRKKTRGNRKYIKRDDEVGIR